MGKGSPGLEARPWGERWPLGGHTAWTRRGRASPPAVDESSLQGDFS